MKTSEIFDTLLANLKVGDTATAIAARLDEITKVLNKDFRSKDACTDYKLMVGSFGRHTAIKGISDLDMVFILPLALRPTTTVKLVRGACSKESATTSRLGTQTQRSAPTSAWFA